LQTPAQPTVRLREQPTTPIPDPFSCGLRRHALQSFFARLLGRLFRQRPNPSIIRAIAYEENRRPHDQSDEEEQSHEKFAYMFVPVANNPQQSWGFEGEPPEMLWGER
jgi:hypothetical protein